MKRAFLIWALILFCAILNGIIRERLLAPLFGHELALPLSGLILSAVILFVTAAFYSFLRIESVSEAWRVGGFWLLLTIGFEFLFGHFVGGASWSTVLQAYDPTSGNLWIVVLAVTFFSPYIIGKRRQLN